MFKVGDKVKRSQGNYAFCWKTICIDRQLCPDGVFTVSHIEKSNNIRCQELGCLSFEPSKFELVQKANQIRFGDIYKTQEGRIVRIICVDFKQSGQNIVGLIDCGDTELVVVYDSNGKDKWDSPDCLVLPWDELDTDWSEVAVDTLIEIDYGHTKVRRYFSHIEIDRVCFFRDGTTSKTCSGITAASKQYCKIYKEEK